MNKMTEKELMWKRLKFDSIIMEEEQTLITAYTANRKRLSTDEKWMEEEIREQLAHMESAFNNNSLAEYKKKVIGATKALRG